MSPTPKRMFPMALATRIESLEPRITPAKFLPTLSPSAVGGSVGFNIPSLDGEIQKVTNIGDFNGDGRSDLAIVAPGFNNDAGKVYIIFGRADGFPDVFDLTTLNGTNGFSIAGVNAGDQLGAGVDGGDLNGDGKADLAIGAPGFDDGSSGKNSGAVYVIFGTSTSAATFSLSSLSGPTGFQITGGTKTNQAFGTSVFIGKSINGDAFEDLVVGAPGYDKNSDGSSPEGRAAVVFGKATGFANLGGLSSLDGITGFTIEGASGDRLGSAVIILDDINGDGRGEINVGTSRDGVLPLSLGDGESDIGYIIFGKTGSWPATTVVTAFEVPDSITIRDMRGAEIGSYFRTQDFNGDGTLDLLGFGGFIRGSRLYIGGFVAPRDGTGIPSNSYYPEQWKVTGFLDNFSLFSLSRGGNLFIDGGDFNGDGYIDMIVDADRASLVFGSDFSGIHYVGKKDAGLQLKGLSSLQNTPRAQFIGDFNGDGFDDLALQSNNVSIQETISIVYGTDREIARNGKSASWTDTDGDRITVKVDKGQLDLAMFHFSPAGPNATGLALDALVFPSASYPSLTISAKKITDQGDGLIKIGRVDAMRGYGKLTKISGSVGEFDAGQYAFSIDVLALGLMPDGSPADPSDLDGTGSIVIREKLSSNLAVEILKSLKVGTIADGVNIAASYIASLQAETIGEATITARALNKLVVTGNKASEVPGDFKAHVTLDNGGNVSDRAVLGSVSIAGVMKGAVIDVAGPIGKVTVGAIEDSTILAGYRPTNIDAPLAGGLFLMQASIKKLAITGKAAATTASGTAFANSSVIASTIGRVTIPSLDETNDETAFGIAFGDSVGAVVVNQPKFTYDKETGGTQTIGDFKVLKL